MQYSREDIDRLIVRAVEDDGAAMESLLLHFYDPLLAFVRRLVGRDCGFEAEDVVQVAMTEAFSRAWAIEPRGGDAFFAWLKSIARTRLANLVEAARARKRGGGLRPVDRIADADGVEQSVLRLLAGPTPSPSRIALREEAHSAVRLALARLAPEKRRLIAMRYGQELSYEEIAAREGKNAGAVRMFIHRTLAELRELIERDLGEFSLGQ